MPIESNENLNDPFQGSLNSEVNDGVTPTYEQSITPSLVEMIDSSVSWPLIGQLQMVLHFHWLQAYPALINDYTRTLTTSFPPIIMFQLT